MPSGMHDDVEAPRGDAVGLQQPQSLAYQVGLNEFESARTDGTAVQRVVSPLPLSHMYSGRAPLEVMDQSERIDETEQHGDPLMNVPTTRRSITLAVRRWRLCKPTTNLHVRHANTTQQGRSCCACPAKLPL
jgi:hypothetical protein